NASGWKQKFTAAKPPRISILRRSKEKGSRERTGEERRGKGNRMETGKAGVNKIEGTPRCRAQRGSLKLPREGNLVASCNRNENDVDEGRRRQRRRHALRITHALSCIHPLGRSLRPKRVVKRNARRMVKELETKRRSIRLSKLGEEDVSFLSRRDRTYWCLTKRMRRHGSAFLKVFREENPKGFEPSLDDG
ncbi:unnamed protein product, partial [Heterotrigona itama]